jgi:hypothetical protein
MRFARLDNRTKTKDVGKDFRGHVRMKEKKKEGFFVLDFVQAAAIHYVRTDQWCCCCDG